MPMRPKQRPPAMSEATANDYRKILAFASSALAAAPTLTEREALEVIAAIARAHVAPGATTLAIARHLDRVAAEIAGGSHRAKENARG